ncbi:MAG: ArgE/DapE family deacylase [Anaerolineae bacterium]|nr:ArgE/DapE family deacylase [Anaerolineae bacterium]
MEYSHLSAAVDRIKPDLIALLQDLVRIPSYPCTIEQNKCLDLIADFLNDPSIRHHRWKPNWEQVEKVVAPSNGALLYTHNDTFLKTRDQIGVLVSEYGEGSRLIVLNGHVDIVGVEPMADWTVDPFSGFVKDGRLYGRGAIDMKGGLVGLIGALKALAETETELKGRVQLHAVPEEETGGNGTLACIEKGFIGDATVFAETTDLRVLYHHTGIQDFKIKLVGNPGFILRHSPGVDSVYAMGKVLRRLEELQHQREIEARKRIPDFLDNDSPGFINVGSVRAGEWDATCPTYSFAQGLMSLLPGETPQEALSELEAAVKEAVSDHPWFVDHPPLVFSQSIGHLGGELTSDHPLVSAFTAASTQVGINPAGLPQGRLMVCDAKITQGGGFSPSIVFGPKGWSAHAPDECVEIESVIQCAKVTAAGVVNYLSRA